MGYKANLIYLVILAISVHNTHGQCVMYEPDGTLVNWHVLQHYSVNDTFIGEFYTRNTDGINGINGNITVSTPLERGPYLNVKAENSQFSISTTDEFSEYEEYETELSISFSVLFHCNGSPNVLTFSIDITDTNNNSPKFIPLPNDVYEYKVVPPLPRGFQITGCWNNMTVRDIDLTTQSVEFAVHGTNYFEIEFDANSTTETKEFHAILKTSTFIRSIPEAIEFRISATDVDLTNDPNRTSYTTVRIISNNEFAQPEEPVFSQTFYLAKFADQQIVLQDRISLRQGYHDDVQFSLKEYLEYFSVVRDVNDVSIRVDAELSSELLQHQPLLLVVQAEREHTSGATATIVVEMPEDVVLSFSQRRYLGQIIQGSLVLDTPLTLIRGSDLTLQLNATGDLAEYFTLSQETNNVIIQIDPDIPSEMIADNAFILLDVEAAYPKSVSGYTTVILEVVTEPIISVTTPVFEEAYYIGHFSNETGLVFEQRIQLTQIYEVVSFDLIGDQSQWFDIISSEYSVEVVLLQSNPITPEVIAENQQLVFVVTAQRPGSDTGRATIVVQLSGDVVTPDRILSFDRVSYFGSIRDNTVNLDPIFLSEGYVSGVLFTLHGDLQRYFGTNPQYANVTLELLEPIAEGDIPLNGIIILNLEASDPIISSAFATIVLEIEVNDSTPTLPDPQFAEAFYVGTYSTSSGLAFETPITLIEEGFDESVDFHLESEQSQWFDLVPAGNFVRVIVRENNPIPPAVITSNQQLLFVITAQRPGSATARATIVVLLADEVTSERILGFDRVSYVGSVVESTVNLDPIVLSVGYASGVLFTLHGDLQRYFRTNPQDATVTLELPEPIAEEDIPSNGIIVLNIEASDPTISSAFATIVLEIEVKNTSPILADPIFAESFYVGTFSSSNGLSIETITLSQEFNDSVKFGLEEDDSQWFELIPTEDSVQVVVREDNPIPPAVIADNQQLIFVVTAERPGSVTGRTTVVIQLINDGAALPKVSFDTSTYVLRVEIGQTGLVGSVRATADNGEAVTYSLIVDNEHLQSRIYINNEGEIHLSVAAYSGMYSFQVVATAIISRATASAVVHLSIEAITTCENGTAIAPLIVLDRDEEEPLRDLVLLDPTEHAGCRYTLTNRWPANQSWLYVNETGLHATAIDREHPSIAFMALSQVTVELTLVCHSDVTRTKRSVSERQDWLGPYDYGTKTWLLGETILFDPKRSIVNLIVNDINDNAPIFVGKESEPIIVGYPARELQQSLSPRSLAELQATDADVGINAALVYWSSEPALAVSPTTGFVHVRNEQRLEHNQVLTVNATDLNGQGRTGSITLMVKLLGSQNIAVVTIRNAFLEDENRILNNISNAIGYEVRALGSTVMSESEGEYRSRMKRELTIGASLELYIYGLLESEPVDVTTLKTDINNAAVITDNIASILSLEDHLEGLVICDHSGRDAGLLAATIVLSVLLFILIAGVIVWFLLTRKRSKIYEQFSDANSVASRNESLGAPPKPLEAVAVSKPRLNIEELKKSEKRLQDMLSAPIEPDSLSQTQTPLPEPLAPIVIIKDKLKDGEEESDDDEFGERMKNRRKSVTFNENVEKIIHVEEDTTDKEDPVMEVFKL